MPIIKIIKSSKYEIPTGTKIIRNDDEFVTLAKKASNYSIKVLTIETQDAAMVNFLDDSNWTEYSFDEILEIVKVFNIK